MNYPTSPDQAFEIHIDEATHTIRLHGDMKPTTEVRRNILNALNGAPLSEGQWTIDAGTTLITPESVEMWMHIVGEKIARSNIHYKGQLSMILQYDPVYAQPNHTFEDHNKA